MIVDPYMDHKVLENFALLAPQGVSLRLLTGPYGAPSVIAALLRFIRR